MENDQTKIGLVAARCSPGAGVKRVSNTVTNRDGILSPGKGCPKKTPLFHHCRAELIKYGLWGWVSLRLLSNSGPIGRLLERISSLPRVIYRAGGFLILKRPLQGLFSK